MSEISKYEEQKKKMDGLCEEHDLVYSFRKEEYPITLTLRTVQGTGVQLSMLEEADGENYISPGASLKLIFAGGELNSIVSGGTFTISKTLRTKIENIFLKMCSFWQQYFFRFVIENRALRTGMFPVIDEGDTDDTDEPSEEAPESDEEDGDTDVDGLIDEAIKVVRMENKATTSLLQRRLKVTYSAAGKIMDELEARGIVGPYKGSEPREVLPTDLPDDEDAAE